MILPRRMLMALTVPAVTLAACGGGGNSDKDKLTSIIKDGDKTPASVCDHLEASLLKQIGGKAGCVAASKSQKPEGSTIDDIKVTGDTAVAQVHNKKGKKTTINFKKVGGDWKVTGS